PPREKPGKGRLLFYRAVHLTLIGPDGKDEKRVSENRGEFLPSGAWLAPDGKRIAFLVRAEREPAEGRDLRRKAYVRGIDEAEPCTDLKVGAQHLVGSPDGPPLRAAELVPAHWRHQTKALRWLRRTRA